MQLLKQNYFEENFDEVYLCVPYGVKNLLQETIDDYKAATEDLCSLIIHEGLLNPEKLSIQAESKRLIIYEDMFDTIASSQMMSTFQTFSCRKLKISTIIIGVYL